MNKIKKLILLFLILALAMALTGCQKMIFNFNEASVPDYSCQSVSLSDQEMRLIALHEKSSFEKKYIPLLGSGFWDKRIESGETYEAYVKDQYIGQECETLVVLNAMAEEASLTLSQAETKSLEVGAKKLYESMTEDELAFTGASLSDVISLLTKYEKAALEIEVLLNGTETEISDETARVADIGVIHFENETLAQEAKDLLDQGDSFFSLASRYSVDETLRYSVSRTDLAESVRDTVFALKEGETSPVLEVEGEYYLVFMEQSYNTLLSLKNKTNLVDQLELSAWKAQEEAYAKIHEVTVRKEALYRLSLSEKIFETSFDLFAYFRE